MLFKHKILSLIVVAFLLVQIEVKGQTATCADFTLVGISENPLDSSESLVSVQFSQPSSVYINYPHVSAILDCNGDTISIGTIFFPAQTGGTTNNHPVTAVDSSTCLPLTIIFVYADEFFQFDTCLMTYGTTSSLIDSFDAPTNFSIYPNPTINEVVIQSSIKQKVIPYFVYDQAGKLVLKGELYSEKTIVDISILPRGIYLFRIEGESSQKFKVVKE